MREPVETLIPLTRASLYRAALAICRDRQEAENVVQETYWAYCRSSRQFNSLEHIHAWLLRVAINRAKDYCRSAWRKHHASLDELTKTIPFEEQADQGVFQAVLRLPTAQRAVIYLYYYEDRSVQEVARILRMRENTVKSHLRRGRQALKNSLQEEWENDEP